MSRFAREMKAHVPGIALSREGGVRLLSAPDGETDEMTEGMVTIMAVFAQIESQLPSIPIEHVLCPPP